jgi:hypothetical protein
MHLTLNTISPAKVVTQLPKPNKDLSPGRDVGSGQSRVERRGGEEGEVGCYCCCRWPRGKNESSAHSSFSIPFSFSQISYTMQFEFKFEYVCMQSTQASTQAYHSTPKVLFLGWPIYINY